MKYPCMMSMVSYFNPRPREGGRPRALWRSRRHLGISIHAPARGGDAVEVNFSTYPEKFQSTPPRGGATLIAGELIVE